ncbi:hypothetical protein ADL22_19870 [Streptomyces sp. NRRL F-4489]|uniref:CPBP family glutamic-type intramembrane protease n=1 Tax=Streptomyces sp. NRRL F-4489 TaxID=1609095 RepID=UPI00074824B9|nr:CPBP family glutamic-type intramembrane protease [Streptomyces sp. NRRL F-4489]KUL37898.1 hypothetical protein ADL22_19870 [Streptomyces sp. NRRL F-4489]
MTTTTYRPDHPPRTTRARGPGWRACGRALAGGAVMACALGAGNAAGPALARLLGARGYLAELLPAALVTLLAVPAVLALRRAAPPAPALGLGPRHGALPGLLRGLGTTAGCAALVLGAGTAAGWVHWSALDPPALLGFLLRNAPVALLLEALPEETTLRGHTWTALSARFGGAATALGTTLVFLLVPAAAAVVQTVLAPLLGGPPPSGLTPAGGDPIGYLVLLTVFGLTLVAARTAPGTAPLWTAIGTHLGFLSVNRVVFQGLARDAGWSAAIAPAHAAVLELAWLAATAAAFTALRRTARHRGPV